MSDNTQKYKQIKINVLPDEWQKLKDDAKENNLQLSGHCRKLLQVENDLDEQKITKMIQKLNSDFLYQMSAIGRNINQIAKYVNTKRGVDKNVLISLFETEQTLKVLQTDYQLNLKRINNDTI